MLPSVVMHILVMHAYVLMVGPQSSQTTGDCHGPREGAERFPGSHAQLRRI